MKITIIIIAICLLSSLVAAGDQDYLESYIRSRGGSIRYKGEIDQAPDAGNNVTVNVFIQNTNPQPQPYWPYDPAAESVYFQERYDTWRYGSPSDVRRYWFNDGRRHTRWRK